MRPFLRRALLYDIDINGTSVAPRYNVPGSNSRMIEKSRSLNVDCITYDLEDSVTLALKPLARVNVRRLISSDLGPGNHIREQAIRINSVSSGLAEQDLNAVLIPEEGPGSTNIDTIVIPKVESANDIAFVSDMLTHCSNPTTKLLALIESARAILNIREICTASTRLSGLIFAAEDYSLDVGLQRTPSLMEMIYARQTIVTAAVAHKLSAIDLVCTDYKDVSDNGPLARECRDGAMMGFTGKQVIHPTQVELTQRLFSPSEERVEWAVRIVIANKKAERAGRGAWTLDGKMIDAPVIEVAKRLVEKAELAGVDVQALREKYSDVIPE